MEIYLDNSATTKPHKKVVEAMAKVMEETYGNPSSMHMLGVNAEKYLKESSETIAATLKCKPSEILFTSGGTESDNTALLGVARAKKRAGKHIITTKIEHPAILEPCAFLEKEGFEITYLSTDEKGLISIDELKSALRPDTILVSVMHTNNEIGALEPVTEAGAAIKEYDKSIFFHVDAVQGYGKCVISPKKSCIDLLSVSAHKIHGPRGVGFLYIKDGIRIDPILFGGGQQKGMRSGTENVAGIYGMALAAKTAYDGFEDKISGMYSLKKFFTGELVKFDDVFINGIPGNGTGEEEPAKIGELQKMYGAPHIISASFEGIRSEVLLHALEDKGIYVSSGSACASNRPHISATLSAIGLRQELLDSTIRFSMSEYTTKEELEYTLEVLNEIIPTLRRFTRR